MNRGKKTNAFTIRRPDGYEPFTTLIEKIKIINLLLCNLPLADMTDIYRCSYCNMTHLMEGLATVTAYMICPAFGHRGHERQSRGYCVGDAAMFVCSLKITQNKNENIYRNDLTALTIVSNTHNCN